MDEFPKNKSPEEFLSKLDECVDSYQRAKKSGKKNDFKKAYKKARRLYWMAWTARMCHLIAQIIDCAFKLYRKDYIGVLIGIIVLIGLILSYVNRE